MQLCGSVSVGPVSALLAVLALVHLPWSSTPSTSASTAHLLHQGSGGTPGAAASSSSPAASSVATSIHPPAASESTSVTTAATSEHAPGSPAVHEATSSPAAHPPGAAPAAVSTWRGERGWEKPFWFGSLALVTLRSPGEILVSTARVGALPVAGAVLDAPARGVSPGSPRSSGGEASPLSTSASHPAHGAAGATGPPWATRPPRTSAERGGHSPRLPGGHPAPHAVHRALLARQADLELVPLEILPIKPFDSCFGGRRVIVRYHGISFWFAGLFVDVEVYHRLPSPFVHLDNTALLEEICQILQGHIVIESLHIHGTVVRVLVWVHRWA